MTRRRNWIAFAIVCMTAILTPVVVRSWRVDHRFVGVWQGLNPVGNDAMSISTIMDNGELTNVSRHDHFGVAHFTYEWWVTGDEFCIRSKNRSSGWRSVRDKAAEFYGSVVHGTKVRPSFVYQIHGVSPDSIRMTFPDGTARVITRVAGSPR